MHLVVGSARRLLGSLVDPPVLDVVCGRVDGGLVGLPAPRPSSLLVRGDDGDPGLEGVLLVGSRLRVEPGTPAVTLQRPRLVHQVGVASAVTASAAGSISGRMMLSGL